MDPNQECGTDINKVLAVIKSGTLDEFKELMKNTTSLSDVIVNNLCSKPIHIAALFGRMDFIEYLLTNRVNVDEVDKHEVTPLHYAAMGGQLEVINFLIKNKANVEAVCLPDKRNFLDIAAFYGRTNVLKQFCKRQEMRKHNKSGRTKMHYAIIGGQLSTIEYLIDNGFNLTGNWFVRFGLNYLHLAIIRKQADVVAYFLNKNLSLEKCFKDGQAPIHLAAEQGSLEIVKLLVENKVKSLTRKGDNILHISSEMGHRSIAEYALAHGIDLNDKNNFSCTPLYLAVKAGHVNIVEVLLDNKADINATLRGGYKPIHVAVYFKRKTILELLLRRGANINERTVDDERTPLHIATERGDMQMIEFLLTKNANINAVNKKGQNVLHIAAYSGYLDIFSLFETKGMDLSKPTFDGNTPLHYAALEGQRDIVDLLDRLDARVNCKNARGVSPLCCGIKSGNAEIVRILMRKSLTLRDETERPLHVAVYFGHLEIVKTLIDYGFDVDEYSLKQLTPLYIAARENQHEIAEYLVKKGADVSKRNADGKRPFRIAQECGHDHLGEFLLQREMCRHVADGIIHL